MVPEDLDSNDGNEGLASKAMEAPQKGCSGQVCSASKEKIVTIWIESEKLGAV